MSKSDIILILLFAILGVGVRGNLHLIEILDERIDFLEDQIIRIHGAK